MPIQHCNVIVFDLDDTLYLERDYVRSGFQAVDKWVSHHLSVDGFFDRAWAIFQAGKRQTIFNMALADLGLKVDPDLVRQLVDVYRHHPPQITLLPDALRCLDFCSKKLKKPIALISDGPLASQQNKVNALQLDQYIQYILLTDQWGRAFWKPHPQAYTKVESYFQAQPQQCCYIADNPYKDFITPNARGWLSIQVRRKEGEYSSNDTNNHPAALACHSLDELIVI